MSKKLLRQIRPIDYYLQLSQIKLLVEGSSKEFVLKHLRTALDKVREAILQGKVNESDNIDSLVTSQITSNWKASLQSSLCYVINATGTLLHTNLGRAPLAKEALDAINLASFSYTNLEYELQTGKRGSRNSHCELQLKELLACEAAVVVNNCAAAVMLVLDEMAKGGEVIISRGELIEIGGAFRIPDVMKRSGAVLRDVGTTN
ncbi:MAG: L-seryl-tRNA(Sec) selenium transferase, partial [Blastocatellia bacterium]|nr:L-seryl-tRNA(Sec) selenium transferase [Blastocatellia bacterium]